MNDASESGDPTAAAWRPRYNPWLIAAAVMLGTFMEVLDTSVANVALPHIGGSLSATPEEATWVLTSYLVSNAIILPTTAWLSGLFGRKRFLIACIVLFTLASAACGAAASLGMLIVARVLQGVGGGALQPIAQAILMESFPPARRGIAMAMYSMGVIVAPILGPTLGGWITDQYSWRWVFYINLPIGVLAVLMASAFIEDPPYLRRSRLARLDYLGFAFMAIWLGTLQVMLDKGQEEDWFAAAWIRWFAVISIVAMIAFVIRELLGEEPIVDLRVLRNRNFAVGTVLITVLGVVLYGTTAMLPLFLQTLLGYTALDSGLAVSPRGLGALAAALVVGRLIGLVDSRLLIAGGFVALGMSGWMYGHMNLDIARGDIVAVSVLNGMASGLIFIPLSTTAMARLRNEQMGSAAGLQSHAERRRRHWDRLDDHLSRAEYPDPSGAARHASHTIRSGLSAVAPLGPEPSRAARRSRDGVAASNGRALRPSAASGDSPRIPRQLPVDQPCRADLSAAGGALRLSTSQNRAVRARHPAPSGSAPCVTSWTLATLAVVLVFGLGRLEIPVSRRP